MTTRKAENFPSTCNTTTTTTVTPCNTDLLEKLTGSQLVKKFPTFYGTWGFISAFTRACHLSIY